MCAAITQQFLDDFSAAEKLFKQGQLRESLARYETLLEQQPEQVAVLNNLGLVHEKLGDHQRAQGYYQRCHERDPDQIVFVNNLANTCSRLGQWDAALPLLKRVVAQRFDHERNAEKLALCLFNIRSKRETAEFIESVIAEFPDNDVLNRLLGRALLHLDSHPDGLRYLQKGSGVIVFDDRQVGYLN